MSGPPNLAKTFRDVRAELRRQKVAFAIVGGLAVSARSRPRFTQDIDLAVAVSSDAEAEAVVQGLGQRGFRVLAQVEQTATGRLATVRLQRTGVPEAPVVDLLFASCGIEPEIVAAAESLELFPRISAPIARVEHLLAMKLLSRDPRTRQQDDLDVSALLQELSLSDADKVTEALRLITRRGFHRRRRLLATWNRLRPRRPT